MSLAQPKFLNNVLTLGFPSETQVIYFNDIRNELASYFKELHQIKGLAFNTEVIKEVETHKNLMTVTQRFESLRADNPAIEKLYRLFQLRME
jgi:molybdopterin-biosynthesis enzyme MoeA-like protein